MELQPLPPSDYSHDSNDSLLKESMTTPSKVTMSVQLGESLEKTRSMVNHWRARSDSYSFETVGTLNNSSTFDDIRDKDDELSSSPSREDDTTMSESEKHQSSDNETDIFNLASRLIIEKREKKDAALLKLKDLLSSISVSHSYESDGRNLSATFSSGSTEYPRRDYFDAETSSTDANGTSGSLSTDVIGISGSTDAIGTSGSTDTIGSTDSFTRDSDYSDVGTIKKIDIGRTRTDSIFFGEESKIQEMEDTNNYSDDTAGEKLSVNEEYLKRLDIGIKKESDSLVFSDDSSTVKSRDLKMRKIITRKAKKMCSDFTLGFKGHIKVYPCFMIFKM